MDIKLLTEFVVLAENGNFMDAAEELFISQSTLSKHIMLIEKELGHILFDRSTRHVRLSEEGKIFLPYAMKIVKLQDEYTKALRESTSAGARIITLASTSQMVHYSVIEALAQYKHANRSDKLNVIIEPHKNLKKLLLQHKCDFAWIGEVSSETEDDSFVRLPFLDDPMVALFPTRYAPLSKQSVSMHELEEYSIVMQDNSSVEQQIFIDACKEKGVYLSVSSIPGGKTLVDFARKGIGVAIMLRTPAISLSCGDVTIMPIQDSPVIHVSLIYLKNNVLSAPAKRFLDFIYAWKNDAKHNKA